MKAINKRLLRIILTTITVCTVLLGLAVPAFAANETVDITDKTVTVAESDINAALSTAVAGDTITVTGTLTGVTAGLSLNVPVGVTVQWEATFTGTGSIQLLSINGGGDLVVSGGTLSVDGDTSSAISSDGDVTVLSGTVSTTGDASYTLSSSGNVIIEGGTVSADGDYSVAVLSVGDTIVSGGTISAIGEYGSAITSYQDAIVTDGTVSTQGDNSYTIGSFGDTFVSGGMISSDGDGSYTIASNGVTTVSGGTLSANGSGAVFALDGTATANATGGTISMSNGAVLADTSTAINIDPITVSSDVTVLSSASSAETPYQITFTVADAGTASGSSINATYNGKTVASGIYVSAGGTLVLTLTGAGATNYTYAWTGVGTNGQTSNAITITSLGANVDALGTVTGSDPDEPSALPETGDSGTTFMILSLIATLASAGIFCTRRYLQSTQKDY